ncbi:MAG: HRDC domain-containing protein [Coriobacteriaceae bacterium]
MSGFWPISGILRQTSPTTATTACAPKLAATPRARAHRVNPKTCAKKTTRRVGRDSEELFEALRVLRMRLVRKQGVAPYIVFSDATLRAMVKKRPHTKRGFLGIPGAGNIESARYGNEFLKELARWDMHQR